MTYITKISKCCYFRERFKPLPSLANFVKVVIVIYSKIRNYMRSQLSLWGRPLCPSNRLMFLLYIVERDRNQLQVSVLVRYPTQIEVYVKRESTVFSTGFPYRSNINMHHTVSSTPFSCLPKCRSIHYSFNRLFQIQRFEQISLVCLFCFPNEGLWRIHPFYVNNAPYLCAYVNNTTF